MPTRSTKKAISPRKSKSSVTEMSITEFNHIIDEVDKRFDPKFEMINNKIIHIEKRFDTKFDMLENKIDTSIQLVNKDIAHITKEMSSMNDKISKIDVRFDRLESRVIWVVIGAFLLTISTSIVLKVIS